MSVGQDYLLAKPPKPSKAKQFLDTHLVPFGVNAAGRVEVALDSVSVRTGIRPAVILAGGTGLLALILVRLLRRRRSGMATRFGLE